MNRLEYKARNSLIRDRNIKALEEIRLQVVKKQCKDIKDFNKKIAEVAKNAYGKEKYIPKKLK